MVHQLKVALLTSLCCVFPGAHTATSGEEASASSLSASSPMSNTQLLDGLVENPGVTLDNMDIEKCRRRMLEIKISTDAELDTVVEDFNDKLAISEEETATFFEGTDIPPEEETMIERGIDETSYLLACLQVDSGRLVSAESLLDLPQVMHIWHNNRWHHCFKNLSSHGGFECKRKLHDESEHSHPTDWRNTFSLICRLDDKVWAVEAWNKAREKISEDDLEEFTEDVVKFCAKYDAAKVFEALNFAPIQLKKTTNVRLMENCKSIKLLELYRNTEEEQKYLHLDAFTLPESVEELDLLLLNPSDFPRMAWFIEKCCKEGRLDLLKHLHKLNLTLIPNKEDLLLAVREERVDIVEWAFEKEISGSFDWSEIAIKLAVNGHGRIFESILNKDKLVYELQKAAIRVGFLDAIEQIHRKWPTAFNLSHYADEAALHKHLPVLKWFNEKFGFLPHISYLENATTDMLDWWLKSKIEARNTTLGYAALFKGLSEMRRFDFIQWIHEQDRSFSFHTNESWVSSAMRNQKDMIWAYENLKIQPKDIFWAFVPGDLEAIELAEEMFKLAPSDSEISCVAANDHLHMIKWLHKRYLNKLSERVNEFFINAIVYGHLRIADYLVANFTIKKRVSPGIGDWVHGDKRLNTLKWIHAHPNILDKHSADSEISSAVKTGNLNILKWYDENIIPVSPSPALRELALKEESTEVYIYLLEKYFKGNQQSGLDKDLQSALDKGNWKAAKAILEKDRSQDGKKFTIRSINRSNYLTVQWLKANDRWRGY